MARTIYIPKAMRTSDEDEWKTNSDNLVRLELAPFHISPRSERQVYFSSWVDKFPIAIEHNDTYCGKRKRE